MQKLTPFIICISISLFLIFIYPSKVNATPFNANNAYEHTKYLVEKVGPRPAGSKAEIKAAQYIYYILNKYGWKVREQPFSKIIINSNPLDIKNQTIKIVNSQNIIAELPGEKTDTIIIGAHYDTAGINVPGAVDNASGVGVVLELARVLAQNSNEISYEIILFGAEEYGLIGSNYYVAQADLSTVNWMLNVDMIGDPIEIDVAGKKTSSPELIRSLAAIARKQNLPFHLSRENIMMTRESSQGGTSDFSPFLDQGIPAAGIGIAGRPSGYFHSPEDKVKEVSISSMKRVGDYIIELVKGVRLSRSGPRVWDNLFVPFKLNQYLLIIPTWALRLLLLFTIAISIILLGYFIKNQLLDQLRKYIFLFLLTVLISFIVTSFSWFGELLWQNIKHSEIIWQAFPEIYLAYRVIVLGALFLAASMLILRILPQQCSNSYWLIGYISLLLGLILMALIRIDLALPLIFWVLTYSLLFFYPNTFLVIIGPYFFYTLHWELLNSQQWQSFYEILHEYYLPFTFFYAILFIPFNLSMIYVIERRSILKQVIPRKFLFILLSVIIIATIALGFVPSYTQKFPQFITIREEYNKVGETGITISSQDILPLKLLSNYNAKKTKELTIPQTTNTKYQVDSKVTVDKSGQKLRNIALKQNYNEEPYILMLKFESDNPFRVIPIKNLIPMDKLPRNLDLKGKKRGDTYYLLFEKTPPHQSIIEFTIESESIIRLTIKSFSSNIDPKIRLNLDNVSVSNEILYESKFEI